MYLGWIAEKKRKVLCVIFCGLSFHVFILDMHSYGVPVVDPI